MRPCARTPIRASGVGRKEHHLFGVPGATTFLREGRGGSFPPRPWRLLCRGARDVFPPMRDVPTQTRAFTEASFLLSSLSRALSTALPASPEVLRLGLRHLPQLVFQVWRQRGGVREKVPEPPETIPELSESVVQHRTSLTRGAQRTLGDLPSRTPLGTEGRLKRAYGDAAQHAFLQR